MLKLLSRVSLACIVALSLSGLAMAHEHDDQASHSAIQYGYRNGYADGFQHGQEDNRAGVGYNFRSRDYDHGMRGYESYMGSHDRYREGYRNGYQAGYTDGFHGRRARYYGTSSEPPSSRDGDDYGSRNPEGRRSVGFRIGYQDGLIAGGKDRRHNKKFRPSKHDRYEDADHGYRHEYGSKREYKREYKEGFLAGYQRGYGQFQGVPPR